MTYRRVGEITEDAREVLLMQVNTAPMSVWETFNDANRHYSCWTVSPRLMFVVIPSGGTVDPHRDVAAKGRRLNTVLQTNPQCFNWLEGARQHLEARGIYEFDATLRHWATNDGETDRIVMVETLP